ncbi:hypothetical protein Pmar_PMAR025309 [Perkinsus marinus ATCC 50983]|uniref:Uncharacterized protein n=1 Tax=Perkinsus marinus (strain ATCC 50983 / TXsc) TaxID=423536 RepID=C5K5L0_PERM5|nr:hypothetical protein Pmar_PMAR025309 [Perkinsus marinus ATCC 50983]EER20233.1 hypothetical protein Pmar_PMAR025309 [Perkinsus marinus ATCC 50983]|eukprot:XP_002788437.1 hypothetical protein Pmar_PMAR025309 [Perkinsus marinus ATCC 50983]
MAAAVAIDKAEIAMLALGFTPTDEIVKARDQLGIKTQDEFMKWARGTLEAAAVDALKVGDLGGRTLGTATNKNTQSCLSDRLCLSNTFLLCT